MAIYALSDLHLSGFKPKPMDVFGRHWENHWSRIKAAWNETVSNGDTVLVPGDISWAMTLDEAMVDLNEIAELPGRKILLRGNHDYWWGSITRIRTALPAGMSAVQNDALTLGDTVICGTRGWTCPGSSVWEGRNDQKIYDRELLRLRLTLDTAKRNRGDRRLIAMLHFPPYNEKQEPSGFTELLEEYAVDTVVFGHLHGVTANTVIEGTRNGIEYKLVSCDYLGFRPLHLFD